MAIPLINVGDKIRAALINQLIAGVNGISLGGVIPSTVTGDGTVVSPNGRITFTNSSAVTVNGVFNGSYDNYRIWWNIPSQTGNADLGMRVVAAGIADTSGNYNYMRQFARGSDNTVSAQMTTASSQWILTAGANAAQSNDGYIDIQGPALNRYTAGLAQATLYYNLPQMYTMATGVRHNATQAFDGFTIYPATGTMTGTVRVYGYNNLT